MADYNRFDEQRIDRLINELTILKNAYVEIKKAFDKESEEYRSLLWYKKQFMKMKDDLKLVRWPPKLSCPYCHTCFSFYKAMDEKR